MTISPFPITSSRSSKSYDFLDLDKIAENPIEKKRDEMKTKLETMIQDELAQVQELLAKITTAKHVQAESVNI